MLAAIALIATLIYFQYYVRQDIAKRRWIREQKRKQKVR